MAAGVSICISRSLASSCVAEVRMTRITSSITGVGQQQPFHGVLPLPGTGQKVLRAAANDRLAVAEKLFQ